MKGLRILCVGVCYALCLASLWVGCYALHCIHRAAEYGGSGTGFHWADIPLIVTTLAAIVFFALIASVYGEDL
jgi:hypothetical protein